MSSPHLQPLRDAAALLGGTAALSAYLLVPPGEIDAWLEGRSEPPEAVIGEAIYLVRELTRPRAAVTRIRVAVIQEGDPAG
jgi:hypothetical protein